MSDVLNINRLSLARIGLYCTGLFGLYLPITYLILLLKNNHTIDDAAAVLKILSFLTVIWVNGELVLDTRNNTYMRRLNSAIIILIVLILFGLVMKYLEFNFSGLKNVSPSFTRALSSFTEYITWISVLPMLLYSLLDYCIMFTSQDGSDAKERAKAFFVFNDVVCLLPLVVISSVGLLALAMGVFSKADLETMVSGSLAATLFASAFATKTIELCYERRA
jgi:hypothetical protein